MSDLLKAPPPTKVLLGILDTPSDPSSNRPASVVRISSASYQHVLHDVKKNFIAGRIPATVSSFPYVNITVASNTFVGGCSIILGPYELNPSVDFAVGGNANATASNIATAIGRLPNFTASATLNVVTAVYHGGLGKIDAKINYVGHVQNFTMSTVDGYSNSDIPGVQPPTRS